MFFGLLDSHPDDFLSLKNDVNVPSKRNKHETYNFLLASRRSLTKKEGATSRSG
jgi:hypothetical protein